MFFKAEINPRLHCDKTKKREKIEGKREVKEKEREEGKTKRERKRVRGVKGKGYEKRIGGSE